MNRRNTVLAVFVATFIALVGSASAGGFLSFLEYHQDATNYADIREILITSNGSFVLTGTWGGIVTTLSRDASTGELTHVESTADIGYVGAAVLSPDNTHVYIATGYADSVLAYSRHLGTGALTYVAEYIDGAGSVDGLELATAIAISQDGKHVYAAGSVDDGLAVFSRDAATGALTFVESHFDGAAGVDGLDNPRGIHVAPGGAHVYVASSTDDSVAIFSRDAATGALTYVGKVTDAVGGVSGLNGAYTVTSDPVGNHVYAGGTAIAVFSRDPATGLLTYVEDHTLAFSRALAFDRTGSRLYATSATGDTVTVFQRNPATGQLTLESTVTNAVDGVSGLDNPNSIVLDVQSRSVYVGCETDTLTVFQVGVFEDDFESGTLNEWQTRRANLP